MERVVSTNVFGAFATIQAFYPLLKVLINPTLALPLILALTNNTP